ncbi:MAG: hypothetical protein B7Z51_06685, partial [Methyloversatilis sp. 12-65-5]
ADRVLARFGERHIAAARVGRVTTSPEVWLTLQDERALLWNVAEQAFILAATAARAEAAHG